MNAEVINFAQMAQVQCGKQLQSIERLNAVKDMSSEYYSAVRQLESARNSEALAKVADEAAKKAIGAIAEVSTYESIAVPSTKSRRFRLPIPASQLRHLFSEFQATELVTDVYLRLASNPINADTIHYMDVRAYLTEEIQAAYEFLSYQNNQHVWVLVSSDLASAVRERRAKRVAEIRCNFLSHLASHEGNAQLFVGPGLPAMDSEAPMNAEVVGPFPHVPQPLLTGEVNANCCDESDATYTLPCKTITATLAWTIIVESALLNERLIEDMWHVSESKGCPFFAEGTNCFYGPNPPAEARAAFIEYVRCRWPIRVFALDPVAQQQNIADEFSRRRELQVAMALAFASGQINAQALMRFTRRLEWDMATIGLNQTAVGFSHGADTFGWRFYPRFQTPPTKGTIATFGETLFGGPSLDDDLNQRQLEPGMRECTAIVVMPSFVPYATFDVRTNWFRLTNPKQTEVSMKETMVLSRSIKAMQQSAAQCAQCAHLYRDGEVHRLLRRVDQLERELPLQTMQAQVPFENTAGGFELFDTGITDLAPELIGFYGAPGINAAAPTTLFLIGDGFSVHDTNVIAGGRRVEARLLSRQVMQVDIPTGVLPIAAKPGSSEKAVVDVHLATPYGVSSHLLIPLVKPEGTPTAPQALAWKNKPSLQMWATISKASNGTLSVKLADYFEAPPVLAIGYPSLLNASPTPTLYVQARHEFGGNNVNLGQFAHPSSEINYRIDTREYYITGPNLRNFVGESDAKGLRQLLAPYLAYLLQQDQLKGANPLKIDLIGQVRRDGAPPVGIAENVSLTINIIEPPAPDSNPE